MGPHVDIYSGESTISEHEYTTATFVSTASDLSKKCYICHKDGHFSSDCQNNRKNKTAAAAQEQEKQPARRRSNRRRSVQRSQSPLDWRNRDHDKRKENPKTTTGASCQSKPSPESQIEGCVKDGRLQPANGQSLPYAGALCNDKIRNDLPLCRRFVGNQPVEVLRDTGCNRAAVKKDLINESQLRAYERYATQVSYGNGRHSVLHQRGRGDLHSKPGPRPNHW